MIDRAAFGARIQAAREAAGITMADAARSLGMSYQNLRRIEKGGMMPSFSAVMRIVDVLGLDPKIVAPEWFLSRRKR